MGRARSVSTHHLLSLVWSQSGPVPPPDWNCPDYCNPKTIAVWKNKMNILYCNYSNETLCVFACVYLLNGSEEFREMCRSVSLTAVASRPTDIGPKLELIHRSRDTCTHAQHTSVSVIQVHLHDQNSSWGRQVKITSDKWMIYITQDIFLWKTAFPRILCVWVSEHGSQADLKISEQRLKLWVEWFTPFLILHTYKRVSVKKTKLFHLHFFFLQLRVCASLTWRRTGP